MSLGVQSDLRHPDSCLWYVLATIAGDPGMLTNFPTTVARNRRYWNGMMRDRVDRENRLREDRDIPELTAEDYRTIRLALDARGFSDCPIPEMNEPIDFSHVDFPDMAWFAGFVFGGRTSFEGARFAGELTEFSNATFTGQVTFESAEFCGDFIGQGIEFEESAYFNNATFHQFTNFSHSAFLANTEFDGARFRQTAFFDQCRFAHYVGYIDTVFEENVDFSSAHFGGPTHFQRTNFKAFVPGFFEATLHEYTEWNESKWPKKPQGSDDARDQIQRYQRLARLMNALEKFTDQRFFVRKELHAQRRIERWNVVGPLNVVGLRWNVVGPLNVVGFMNLAYEAICDYGFGLGRVVAIWTGHILLGATALLGFKISQSTEGEAGALGVSEMLCDALLALALSFGNAHGFLDLNRKFLGDALKEWANVPWFELVGAIQTVFGVIILFFLILTIRNRFRMR